jgi:hypothetical protein
MGDLENEQKMFCSDAFLATRMDLNISGIFAPICAGKVFSRTFLVIEGAELFSDYIETIKERMVRHMGVGME